MFVAFAEDWNYEFYLAKEFETKEEAEKWLEQYEGKGFFLSIKEK